MTTKKYLAAAAFLAAVALTPNESISKPITIAVIDTGVDRHIAHLCKYGHRSFIDSEPLKDHVGHGNQMASLINQQIKSPGEYCIVSIKWFDPKAEASINIDNLQRAIQYAVNIKVAYMNISGGGLSADPDERSAVLTALNNGITIVAAAGNENSNLDKSCNYFPACYDSRIITVGNKQGRTTRQPSSNYGHYIKHWEVGTSVISIMPDGTRAIGTGTSQATAITTGKLVNARLRK